VFVNSSENSLVSVGQKVVIEPVLAVVIGAVQQRKTKERSDSAK